MRRKAPPSTIRDVAARAGVSLATVSRVLNASGPVSVSAAEAVRRAVDDLDFRPSPLGRRLRASHSGMIGLVLPSLGSAIADGVATAAQAAGYALLVAVSGGDGAREAEAVAAMLDDRVEGVVLVVTGPASAMLDNRGVPYVPIAADGTAELGRQAVDLLRQRIAGGPRPPHCPSLR